MCIKTETMETYYSGHWTFPNDDMFNVKRVEIPQVMYIQNLKQWELSIVPVQTIVSTNTIVSITVERYEI